MGWVSTTAASLPPPSLVPHRLLQLLHTPQVLVLPHLGSPLKHGSPSPRGGVSGHRGEPFPYTVPACSVLSWHSPITHQAFSFYFPSTTSDQPSFHPNSVAKTSKHNSFQFSLAMVAELRQPLIHMAGFAPGFDTMSIKTNKQINNYAQFVHSTFRQ